MSWWNSQSPQIGQTLFGKVSIALVVIGGVVFCAGQIIFARDHSYALLLITSFVLGLGLWLAGLTGAVLIRTDQWKLVPEKSRMLSAGRWSVILFNALYALFSAWSTYSALADR